MKKSNKKQVKKAYHKPELTRYGTLADLTKGGVGTTTEGGQGQSPVKRP